MWRESRRGEGGGGEAGGVLGGVVGFWGRGAGGAGFVGSRGWF